MGWLRRRRGVFHAYTDGAIRPGRGISGLGVVVRDEQGQIVGWLARRAGGMTCNEAEYEAIILAVEELAGWQPASLVIFTDSRVVVDQAQGRASARAPGLQQRLVRLRAATIALPHVEFRHIPRGRNRLADALANDVADGFVPEGLGHG